MKKTFVAVMNIPSPYRLHLLGELARQLAERGIVFHCHFMAKGHADRPKSWLNPKIDFPHTYWWDGGFGQHHFNPGLVLKLLFSRPDYLMCGSSFDTFTGILIQLFSSAKVKLCWLEGNTKTPGKLKGFIGWLKRRVLGACRYVAVPGQEGKGYIALHQNLTTRRMPEVVFLPNLIDERRFARANFKDEDVRVFRRNKFGVNENTRVCLIPARFDPVKGLKELFELLTPEMLAGWKIVVMGHGPEEQMTMEIVTRRRLTSSVQVIHSVPYEEMPIYYAAADLMMLPSRQDMNPLCVVEALHSGLPIAESDQAGNVVEAVTEGRNGWVLPVTNVEAFGRKLKEVFATSNDELTQKGKMSYVENARFWSTETSIANFLNTVFG